MEHKSGEQTGMSAENPKPPSLDDIRNNLSLEYLQILDDRINSLVAEINSERIRDGDKVAYAYMMICIIDGLFHSVRMTQVNCKDDEYRLATYSALLLDSVFDIKLRP